MADNVGQFEQLVLAAILQGEPGQSNAGLLYADRGWSARFGDLAGSNQGDDCRDRTGPTLVVSWRASSGSDHNGDEERSDPADPVAWEGLQPPGAKEKVNGRQEHAEESEPAVGVPGLADLTFVPEAEDCVDDPRHGKVQEIEI